MQENIICIFSTEKTKPLSYDHWSEEGNLCNLWCPVQVHIASETRNSVGLWKTQQANILILCTQFNSLPYHLKETVKLVNPLNEVLLVVMRLGPYI